MKNESLLSQISSSKPSSTADAEIFNVHRLVLDQKPLMKTRTLRPKKSSKKPISMADADIFYANTTHDRQTVDENSVPAIPKISSKPSSPADAEIFIVHRLLWLRNG
jgi:hypothetical protein